MAAVLPATACGHDDRTSYRISAEYNESQRTLTAQCAVNYVNDGADTDCIEFNLYGNAYRKDALYRPVADELTSQTYYQGTSYGDMQINAVDGCESWEVCGEDENILRTQLGHTLKSGQSVQITIDYTLTLAVANHRTGVAEHAVNLGNFYPQACVRADEGFYECVYYSDGDPFLSDCADYEVEITLPAGYAAATSGKLVSESGNTHLYTLQNARDFAMVLSDEFKTATTDAGGTEVTYYYYDDEDAAAKLAAAGDSLAFFEEKFGEYIYPTFAVVQTGISAGGMEYPALAMINGELENSEAVYAIVHETAHQWWYAMAGSNQIENAWQDEGLAEYSALCFFEAHPDYGYTREGLLEAAKQSYRAYYTVYNQIFGNADTTMNRHLKDFVSDYEYVNIAYNKGVIMFDMLRQSLGDERFFGGLKDYFKASCGKIASPEDLMAAFRGTGVDTDGFFESFTEGKVVI